MSITITKSMLTEALTLAAVAIPRKANFDTLRTLHDALPLESQLCPACGIHLSNGVLRMVDEAANQGGRTLYEAGLLNHDFNCMGCGAEWGTLHDPYVAPATSAPTGKGLKIEKNRPEQNGVKQPSIGGKCRAIWDALDAHALSTGDDPTAKDVKALAATHGWNPNNASIEYYQWRKFNGVSKG